MPASPKNEYDKAERAVWTLRGEVIDLFAQVEYAVGAVLNHAATLPEYQALKPPLPHQLEEKLNRLRKLSEAGPLKSQTTEVGALVDKLAEHKDLRRFMAHAIVEVALKQNGEPIYVFSMLQASNSSPTSPLTLTLTRRDAQSRKDKLDNVAKALASKLESITDGLDKPPKDANKNVR